jgi:hypothetical protein
MNELKEILTAILDLPLKGLEGRKCEMLGLPPKLSTVLALRLTDNAMTDNRALLKVFDIVGDTTEQGGSGESTDINIYSSDLIGMGDLTDEELETLDTLFRKAQGLPPNTNHYRIWLPEKESLED